MGGIPGSSIDDGFKTDRLFTGQRQESSLGLYYYNARWYDPELSRWTSPDSIVPLESQGVQAWDRYAFVNNNPIRYTDPTGHWVDDGCNTEGCEMRTFEDYLQVAKYTAEDRFLSSRSKAARDTIYSFDNPITRGAFFFWALGRLDGVNWKQALVDLLLISGSNLSTGMMGLAMGGDVCPGCGTANPTLLRSTGNIVDDTILPENVGIDGLSTYCQTCGNNIKPGKTYWPLTVEDLRAFSEQNNLNPDQAAKYTPQFGGQGHYSLFTDAYQPNGNLMPNIAASIDQFIRSFPKIKIR